MFTLLIALYLVMGIFLRPEALPGLLPQLSIWLIYAALFALLYLHVKRSGKATISETINLPPPVKLKKLVILSLIFTFASAIFTAEGVGLVIMVTPPLSAVTSLQAL